MIDVTTIMRSLDLDDPRKPAPSGIALTAEDTGPAGIQVAIVHGECFGTEIEWFDEAEVTATVSVDPITGLPILRYTRGGISSYVGEYRGLEADGVTWWRYAQEADPRSYREHCLRVVRRL